jgi:hypothetical protein
MVDLVGVGEFQVEEADLVILEEWPRVPAATMQLDRNITGNLESADLFQSRPPSDLPVFPGVRQL